MSYRNDNREHGFRIYNDRHSPSTRSAYSNNSGMKQEPALQQKGMEIALLQKLHARTKVVGLLEYQNEIKGIRFYDAAKQRFIDIAPWQLNMFPISKLKITGVRSIELVRHEAGQAGGTLLVEFLTRHEVAGLYRANRMVSNDLAAALSGITDPLSEEEYQTLLREIANNAE